MSEHRKLLTIVIANYNYGRFLGEAIRSVVEQPGFEKCELIVVDGGSADCSVEVIKKYADKISWWVSEKDRGQSHAFNKGFARAEGKYLTWLNADDILVPNCLKSVLRQMECHPECDWFTGNFFRFLGSDKTVMEIGWGPHFYPKWMQRPRFPLVIFGPTTFFSKKIYEQVGRIDESLHFCMDNDLWYRFVNAGIKQRRIRSFCWAFRMHEASKTAEFGDHKMSADVRKVAYPELAAMLKKNHVKKSRTAQYLVWLLRALDGSLARRFLLRRQMLGCVFEYGQD